MSYSRWLNSCWYIYYCASSGDTLEEQRVSINGMIFTFPEICKMYEMDDWELLKGDEWSPNWDIIPPEHDHLRDCVRAFIEDATEEYPQLPDEEDMLGGGGD